MANSESSSEKQESIAFIFNLIYSFVLVFVQSITLGLAGLQVLYWAGEYPAYFMIFLISAAAPTGYAGIWYFYAKHRFKKMYFFYLVPLIIFIGASVLWHHLGSKISKQIYEAEMKHHPIE